MFKKITATIITMLMMFTLAAGVANAKTVKAPPGKDMPMSVTYKVATNTWCNYIFWQGNADDLFRQRASLACWGTKTVKEKYRLRVQCLNIITNLKRYRYTKYTSTGAERKMNCSAIEIMLSATDQWKLK